MYIVDYETSWQVSLNILPFDQLIKQAQLLFMHTIEYKLAPKSFDEVWQKNTDRDPAYNLRNANDYYLTHPRTELFKKSTFYALPSVWNSKIQNSKIK